MTEIDPKLSRLYREASTEEPPAALNAAVLDAARMQAAKSRRLHAAEGHEQPQRRERSFWSSWIAPAGAIATLALGVSLALLVGREQPASGDRTGVRPAPPQSWPPASVTGSVKPNAADSAAPGAAATKELPAAAAPAPIPEPPAAVQTPDAAARTRAADAATPGATAPAQAPDPAAPARGPAANLSAPAPAPRPAESAPTEAFPAESRAKSATPATGALKAESGSGSDTDAAFGVPKPAIGSNAGADAAFGGPAAGPPAVPVVPELAPMGQQPAARPPEAWLGEIGRLRRDGRGAEAAQQLVEFRKAYPLYPLPANLRDLQ